MPAWQKRLNLAILLCALVQFAQAQGFTIRSVETSLAEKVYQLHAEIDYPLSPKVTEALRNGVPLVITLDIEVEQERNWWWNKTVAELKQGYMLLYHALSEKYIVNNLNSGAQKDFSHLEDALADLGHVTQLPIIDAKLVNSNHRYSVSLRTYLDLEALPAPVRPLAYLHPHWRLESDWYQWPLQH